MEKFKIVVDTREQNPFVFKENEECLGSVAAKVEYGDYSIEGLEHLLFIERKASVQEIAHNFCEKRFDKLIRAVGSRRYKFIVCEFTLESIYNYPYNCGLPTSVVKKIRLRGPFILSKIMGLQLEEDIHFIFCENKLSAQKFTYNLLKKIKTRESAA